MERRLVVYVKRRRQDGLFVKHVDDDSLRVHDAEQATKLTRLRRRAISSLYEHLAFSGPATVRMVPDRHSGPPLPLPLHVPPGHIVQQIVDEYGILRHLVLSPQTPPASSASGPFQMVNMTVSVVFSRTLAPLVHVDAEKHTRKWEANGVIGFRVLSLETKSGT